MQGINKIYASSDKFIVLDLSGLARILGASRGSGDSYAIKSSGSCNEIHRLRTTGGFSGYAQAIGSGYYFGEEYYFGAGYLSSLGDSVINRFSDTDRYREFQLIKNFDQESLRKGWSRYLELRVFSPGLAVVYDGKNWVKVYMEPQEQTQEELRERYKEMKARERDSWNRTMYI